MVYCSDCGKKIGECNCPKDIPESIIEADKEIEKELASPPEDKMLEPKKHKHKEVVTK